MGYEEYTQLEERNALVLEIAEYLIDYKWTVREIAENVMMSKSTVHRILTEELPYVDYERYEVAKRILRERRI